MKHLRKQCHKDKFTPVCIQTAKACVISLTVTFICFLCFSFINSFSKDHHDSGIFEILLYELILIFYVVIYVACTFVPYNAIAMIFIHYFKIWPYIMYSRKLILVVALLFIIFFSLLNKFSTLNEEYDLCLSCIIDICAIFGIRILLKNKYKEYQLKFKNYYNNQEMDVRSDTIITLILYAIAITACIYISLAIL